MKQRLLGAACVVLVAAGAACARGSTAVQPNPAPRVAGPIAGTARLADGRSVRYSYHFNHNALETTASIGSRLLALSGSGEVMSFDRATLALQSQAARGARASAIAALPSGQALVGFDDGRIDAVDPATLAMTPFAQMDGKILWLGVVASPGGGPARTVGVAVTPEPRHPWWPGISSEESPPMAPYAPRVTLAILPGGPTHVLPLTTSEDDTPFTMEPAPDAFAPDGRGRLWVGLDRGEFGGLCAYVDVATGKVTRVLDRSYDPVRGILVTPDGHVLAYGGTVHLDLEHGMIVRVDGGASEVVRESSNYEWRLPHPLPPPPQSARPTIDVTAQPEGARPTQTARPVPPVPNVTTRRGTIRPVDPAGTHGPIGPIDAIVPDSRPEGGYWVLSEHALYHADASFEQWSRPTDLNVRFVPRNRNSVSNTVTVTSILVSPGDAARLTCPTRLEGFVQVHDGTVKHISFPGQFETQPGHMVADVWQTSLGTLALTSSPFPMRGLEIGSLWRFGGNAWSVLPDRPPASSESDEANGWLYMLPAFDDGRGVRIFWAAFQANQPERPWVRATANGTEELAAWKSFRPEQVFQGPDGSFCAITGDRVQRWESDAWRTIGRDASDVLTGQRLPGPFGRPLIALGDRALPWALYDVAYGRIHRIAESGTSKAIRIEEFSGDAGRTRLGAVLAAAKDDAGAVLLATTKGAFRLHVASGRVQRLDTPELPPHLQSICRDGSGRVWVAGEHLHVSADGGATWTAVDVVPMLGTNDVKRVWADPSDPNGVIVGVADRGVVFVTVPHP